MGQPVSDLLKVLLEKLSSFFDLFDISYLVSGVAVLGAACYWPSADTNQLSSVVPASLLPFWLFVVCYAVGLTASGLGRRVNQFMVGFNRTDHLSKYRHFEQLLVLTNLDVTVGFQQLLQPAGAGVTKYTEDSLKGVYRQMWTTLRERKDIPESMALLRRYWVNSSTLDGLSIAAGLCVVVGLAHLVLDFSGWRSVLSMPSWVAIGSVFVARLLGEEANRYRRYQIEELVDTYLLVKAE
jgi:hypothetical protein